MLESLEDTDSSAPVLHQPIHAALLHQDGGSIRNVPSASSKQRGPGFHHTNFNSGTSEGWNADTSYLSIAILL